MASERKPLSRYWIAEAARKAEKHVARVARGDRGFRRHVMELAQIDDPVERARRSAELMAPAYMTLLDAITFGLDQDDAEKNSKHLRLVADIAARKLSIVGLRAGDVQQFEVSDRFREFLERWNGERADGPRVIDVTPTRQPDTAAALEPPAGSD